LLTYSEVFEPTGTSWQEQLATIGTNEAVAPNGTSTADKLKENGNGTHIIRQSVTSVSAYYTLSIYLKAGERNFASLTMFDGSNSTNAFFDISLGVKGAVSGVAATHNIEPAGNGWYRCSVTDLKGAGTLNFTIRTAETISSDNYTGITGYGIYLWGAQLETGTYAGDYAKTTTTAASTPRTAAYLPDGNGNFVSAGPLLLEDAGTNFLTYSELFTGWSVNQLVPSTASVAAPDGSPTVQLFTEDNTTNVHRIFLASTTGNLTHTHSVFVKNASGTRRVYLSSDDAFGARQILTFDLQTGTLASNSGGWTDPFITAYPNGWYRIGGTITDDGVTTLFIVGLRDDALISYLGDGTSGIYVWGAQLEANPYPTSYIPTQGSTGTRAADVSTSAATTVFESDWYRQDEGTVFAEVPSADLTGGRILQIGDGTSANRQDLALVSSALLAFVSVSNSAQVNSLTANTATGLAKCGYGYKVDDFAWILNAGSLRAETSGSVPVVDRIGIGGRLDTALYLNGTIRRLAYWPQRLPDSTLVNITT